MQIIGIGSKLAGSVVVSITNVLGDVRINTENGSYSQSEVLDLLEDDVRNKENSIYLNKVSSRLRS